MRKALKIILPLVLVLVLLVACYWFFFQYRRDITANLCASFGENAMKAEDYETAVTWYRYAWDLNPADARIALRLTDAYRGVGNFTKIEYVLVNAIAAAPDSTELYVALCGVYVEQGKLLDAQRMLDGIQNETVLATLNAQRPAAPVVSPEGGYYSTYITVSIETADGVRYYMTTNGEYPSVKNNLYTEPVTLEAGETNVCAIAVGENGLVSTAVYLGYTVAGVIEDAIFVDPALEAYVQELLNRGGRTLRTDDLWAITELEVPTDVTVLDDLHYFTGLTSLSLPSTCGSDLSFLALMPHLETLNLDNCALTTDLLRVICSCSSLTTLRMSDCGLSNITPLEGMVHLRVLDLSDNSINNLVPLSSLTNLEELYLQENALTSVSALSGLTGLIKLDLSRNSLKSISPIGACTALEELNVAYNQLSEIDAVGNMTLLKKLDASNNQIEDVSALAPCTQLEIFTMEDNLLTSIDFLNDNSVILEVDIDYNDVEKVPDFPEDCALVVFSAAHNFLNDLSGLAGLQHLNYVNADYNNIRDIDVLRTCPNLTQVNVFGTYITKGGVLEDMGVIVNFTPNVYS